MQYEYALAALHVIGTANVSQSSAFKAKLASLCTAKEALRELLENKSIYTFIFPHQRLISRQRILQDQEQDDLILRNRFRRHDEYIAQYADCTCSLLEIEQSLQEIAAVASSSSQVSSRYIRDACSTAMIAENNTGYIFSKLSAEQQLDQVTCKL